MFNRDCRCSPCFLHLKRGLLHLQQAPLLRDVCDYFAWKIYAAV